MTTRTRKKRCLAGVILPTALAATAAGASTTMIDQIGQQFSQKSIIAAVGDVLVFQNSDAVRHNIRIISDNDGMNDLGVQEPGDRLTFKVDKAGKYRVRCGIHPTMKLSVDVP